MEIKATLNKPYTDKQRLDFVVVYNHQQGCKIKETKTALEAWGLTEAEKEERQKEQHNMELLAQLDAIDLKCIRAIRAIQAGKETEEDVQRLQELELQAEQIRLELGA